jgi:anti-sigma regulatory factor (Ser/Thr protein kinase)
MSTRERIAEYITKHGSATSADLAEHLGLSRQAINVHIRALVDDGKVLKAGSTRSARYYPQSSAAAPGVFSGKFDLEALDESDVYTRVATVLNLKRLLRSNVETVVHYAFTEILNNAIDHSRATRCNVHVKLETGRFGFEVREPGIGIFHCIAQSLRLEDEQAAMIELIKGKTTTMPEAHSGEGIFFTSKAADRFVLRSHRIEIEWNRAHDDVFVSSPHFRKGTTVTFEIRRDSRTKLDDVFSQYAPDEYNYEFQKTRVLVKLLRGEYVSRSEAKRLLLNLDKFREIEIDFKDVERLGQGFADEVFRVFKRRYPGIKVRPVNANLNVAAFIRHAGGEA